MSLLDEIKGYKWGCKKVVTPSKPKETIIELSDTRVVSKKFEILEYVVSKDFTVDGLADKLNELTQMNLYDVVEKSKQQVDTYFDERFCR